MSEANGEDVVLDDWAKSKQLQRLSHQVVVTIRCLLKGTFPGELGLAQFFPIESCQMGWIIRIIHGHGFSDRLPNLLPLLFT